MFTLEEIKGKFEEMKQAIQDVTNGAQVANADNVFNVIDEEVIFVTQEIQDEKHGTVTKTFLVGRVSCEQENGLFEFEPTLTIQIRKDEGLVDEEDYTADGLTEEEMNSEFFLPFLLELNQYV